MEGFLKVHAELDGGHAHNDEEKLKCTCDFIDATQKCVLNAIEQAPKPTPQILLLSASYGWQHLVMAHKAGLCLDVKYDKSKEVATNAGVLQQAGLVNIEDVPYDPCVGQVMRECFIETEDAFESQPNEAHPSFQYTECYKAKATRPSAPCEAPMLQHFIEHGDVIRDVWEAIKNY